MDSSLVRVGGDACARCAARASVDAALVRAGVERITLVVVYVRTPFGPAAVERAKAFVCLPNGEIAKGAGHSRDGSLLDALENAGLDP